MLRVIVVIKHVGCRYGWGAIGEAWSSTSLIQLCFLIVRTCLWNVISNTVHTLARKSICARSCASFILEKSCPTPNTWRPMLTANWKAAPRSIGDSSLHMVSNGIGQVARRIMEIMVKRAASREKAESFAKAMTSGAKELISVGFFWYLRAPIARIVQNRSGDRL